MKEEAAIALRDAVRSGEEPSPDLLSALAEKLAPSDEDELFALARHTPSLRPDVRAGVLAALGRVLDAERRAIVERGPAYLELMDRDRCCGS